MGQVGVLGDVAFRLEELDVDLKRGVGQLAEKLGLGDDFGGHQIEYEQVQGPDVLVKGTALRHHKDVLPLQHAGGGERVGNSDGHGRASFK